MIGLGFHVASTALSLEPFICAEKQRLADALIEAVQRVMILQEQEIANVLSGGEGLARFDLALKAARDAKARAKNAYMRHVRTHGC